MNTVKNLDERINEQVTKSKVMNESLTIDSPEVYTKDAKIQQVQSYLTKANEIMAALNTEIKDVKTLEELTTKKASIQILYNDLRDALGNSLGSVLYNY